MDPSVTERTSKKVTIWKDCIGALIHDYQGRERADQESACDGKIALAHEHN